MIKKFIFITVVLGAGLLGLAYMGDYVISKKLIESTDVHISKWNEIFKGNWQCNVVIMGSSRAYRHYSPQILDSILGINSYNLGLIGAPINLQIVMYNTYRRFNAKPQIIIQNVDFLTMGLSVPNEIQYLPFFFDDSIRNAISEYKKFSIVKKYLPMFRYGGYAYSILYTLWTIKEKETELFVKGYFGTKQSWDGSELAKQTVINYAQDSLAINLFNNHLAKACSENIKVIFVYAPLYIGATEKIYNIEGMYQMYDTIARKYNIPVLDYTYDSLSYDTTYLYNAIHLNKHGAELFSTKLAHDLDSLDILK